MGPRVLMVTAGLGTARLRECTSTGKHHGQGVGAQLPPQLSQDSCVVSGEPLTPHL